MLQMQDLFSCVYHLWPFVHYLLQQFEGNLCHYYLT